MAITKKNYFSFRNVYTLQVFMHQTDTKNNDRKFLLEIQIKKTC